MYNANQFADLSKANVAQANKLAAISVENAEKLLQLNLATVKAVIATGVESATAVAAIKDPQELLTLPGKYAELAFHNALGYSKSVYEISAQMQGAFTAIAEEMAADYTKGLAAWVDKASATAPAGSEAAISAFKSSVAATSAAIDQIQKASKQVVSFADASVRAAAENASKVTVNAPLGKSRKAA